MFAHHSIEPTYEACCTRCGGTTVDARHRSAECPACAVSLLDRLLPAMGEPGTVIPFPKAANG